MATPSSMILRSLRLIGEKAIGDTLSSAEQTAYLADLNTMLDSWSTERLMCYQITEDTKALTAALGTYTIGSGGDINTTRPTRIVQAFVRDAYNSDYPVQIIPYDNYNLIIQKDVSGTYPRYLYCDYAYESGLATLYLYPLPAAGLTLYLESWKQLTQFSTISDTVALPNGYQRAIEYNFAVEVSGGYRDLPPQVIQIARKSKANIKSINLPDSLMFLDPGIVKPQRVNIETGP